MRRQNQPSGRRQPRNARKPVKHFKRKLHFEDGIIWSWRIAGIVDEDTKHLRYPSTTLAVFLRSPAGVSHRIPYTAFFEVVDTIHGSLRWGMCEGECYDRTGMARGHGFKLVTAGPGFKPSTLKKYIQDVLLDGKPWERPKN